MQTHSEAFNLRTDRLGLDKLDDPHHGWVDCLRNDISLEAKQRIMGILTIDPKLSRRGLRLRFPKVEIVTGLLIRRQFYRKLAGELLGQAPPRGIYLP